MHKTGKKEHCFCILNCCFQFANKSIFTEQQHHRNASFHMNCPQRSHHHGEASSERLPPLVHGGNEIEMNQKRKEKTEVKAYYIKYRWQHTWSFDCINYIAQLDTWEIRRDEKLSYRQMWFAVQSPASPLFLLFSPNCQQYLTDSSISQIC